MALTGFKYYYDKLGLDPESYLVHYDFNNTGSFVPSTQGALPQYSGVLNGISGNFWSPSGSGHFGTGALAIQNAVDFASDFWTHFFIYEKTNKNAGILFSSLHGYGAYSGYLLGVTDNNKLYFETYGREGPSIKVSTQIYGEKNAIAIVKAQDVLTFHNYSFDTKELQSQSFTLVKYNELSSGASIGGAIDLPSHVRNTPFQGYIDEYVYIKEALTLSNLKVLFSGFYSTFQTINPVIGSTGYVDITGFAYVLSGVTGITGYSNSGTLSGYDNFGDPVYTYTVTPLTGYLLSGLVQIPLTGLVTIPITGAATEVLTIDNDFGKSFGMNQITYLRKIVPADISYLRTSQEYVHDNLNNFADYDRVNNNFELKQVYNQGDVSIFVDGTFETVGGYRVTGDFYASGYVLRGDYFLDGFMVNATGAFGQTDVMVYDVISGTLETGYRIPLASGYMFPIILDSPNTKLVFLNGLLQLQNVDYERRDGFLTWIKASSGGKLSVLTPLVTYSEATGNLFNTMTNFQRNSSQLFLDGLRQTINDDYLENTRLDLLEQTGIFQTGLSGIYNNNNLFLEH